MHKKTIIFICHGNICRRTMAEFLFCKMLSDHGMSEEYNVISRATSTEELGNPVHPGTRRVLARFGIDCSLKKSTRITPEECDRADYLIIMDENNRRNLRPFLRDGNEKKVRLLLSFAGEERGISDPWYTGDFEETYNDVQKGLDGLLLTLQKKKKA